MTNDDIYDNIIITKEIDYLASMGKLNLYSHLLNTDKKC